MDLRKKLLEEPYRFEFPQAVRLLARCENGNPVGYDSAANDELIRFRGYSSFSFPASEIVDISEPSDPHLPFQMTVAFMGLTGPMGVLPRFYTELIIERLRHKDRTMRDFLDLFNHRLISLFFRATEKYQFFFGYEQAEREARRKHRHDIRQYRHYIRRERSRYDLFSQVLLDVAGVGTTGERFTSQVTWEPGDDDHFSDMAARRQAEVGARTIISDQTLRFFAGLFAQQGRSATALASLLSGYLGVSVEVVQFVGEWIPLDREYQTRLGGQNCELGRTAVAGERVWDPQGKFRVRLGPLRIRRFQEFRPDGPAFRRLVQCVRLFVGQQFEFDVQVVLHVDDVPMCQLGDGPAGARLGWNTWVRNQSYHQHAEDAVFGASDTISCGGVT